MENEMVTDVFSGRRRQANDVIPAVRYTSNTATEPKRTSQTRKGDLRRFQCHKRDAVVGAPRQPGRPPAQAPLKRTRKAQG